MDMALNELLLIDVEDGTKRLGGNLTLYKKLLQKFVDGNYTQAIDSAVASGDLAGAASAAHTVKGVAANLSLKRANAVALELEQQLKNGRPFEETLALLKSVSADTVAQINAL